VLRDSADHFVQDIRMSLDDDQDNLPSDDIGFQWVSDTDSDGDANISKYLPPSKVNEQNRHRRRSNWKKVHMLFADRLTTREKAVCDCAVINRRQVLLVSASGKSPVLMLTSLFIG
jgi:hypothetical protein